MKPPFDERAPRQDGRHECMTVRLSAQVDSSSRRVNLNT